MKPQLIDYPKNTICKNCGSEQIENYCSNCGQIAHNKRFTVKNFMHVFLDAFSIEKGFFLTFLMLFKNPGILINDYLNGKTKAYFNPLKYILIIAGINTALMIWLKLFDSNVNFFNNLSGFSEDSLARQQKVLVYFKSYMNIIMILQVPVSAWLSKLYFRQKKLFYGEHLVILCFIAAQLFSINILLYPIYYIFPSVSKFFLLFGFLIAITYYSYAFKKIFQLSILKTIIGSISIYILGLILFVTLFMVAFMLFINFTKILGINLI